ncbi:MAG: isochorismate synthase [Gemmatimonadaceae bacterium]|nr:isochorismate synthase [Gemmatimonadaceae bacterium]
MTAPFPSFDVERFSGLLAVAGAQARADGRAVLVSMGMPMPSLDPLLAMECVAGAAESDVRLAAHLSAGRMYWTRARDGFALAGIGAVATFEPVGVDRFSSVDRAWTALLDHVVLGDATTGDADGGPVLMGGFSFQPEGPRSDTWRGFPSARLFVPRLQITCGDDGCRIRMSALVDARGVPDVASAELAALFDAACGAEPPALERVFESGSSARDVAYSAPLADGEWRSMVDAGVSAIRRGSFQKVVLAREVRADAARDVDVPALLRHLRAAHADCFVFGYWRGDRAFVGASPERLVRLDGRAVRASSLAGAATRGASPQEDAALTAALLASPKERAEHAAVRDALRDGLAELCDDVIAAEVPSLLTLRDVHHLHTAVCATLRSGHSLLDLVARLHPTPAVGGAPRAEALQFIRDHERLDRGWYAAPIGWMGHHGGEFAVALRSAVIDGSRAVMYAGCGIVADSRSELELAESQLKLQPMKAALAAALAEAAPGVPIGTARAS